MFLLKIYGKNQLDRNEWYIDCFFIYKIYLVLVFRLYKLFRVAFLTYEIVGKIHSFNSFQEILEEIKLKEFSLLDISNKSYRSRFGCWVISNCTKFDWLVDVIYTYYNNTGIHSDYLYVCVKNKRIFSYLDNIRKPHWNLIF
jgi:hypothetical protein